MQLLESSLSKRAMGLLRFIIIKLFYPIRLNIKYTSYFGKNLKLVIKKSGRIFIKGKIRVSDNVELQSHGQLTFGNGCGINSYSRIIAFEKIILGDYVLIAQFVSILDHDHKIEIKNGEVTMKNFETDPIVIGSNVWIGDKVTITKGVKIGDNVVIGANSVVTKDIPSNSVVAGVPSRVLRNLI
jgi:acetyltransferase-like isoleucine patch superfamily enzyme